jgi:hypothetical protein
MKLSVALISLAATAGPMSLAAASPDLAATQHRGIHVEVRPPATSSHGDAGTAVAVDSRFLVVGAPGQTVDGHAAAGAVYVYERAVSGWGREHLVATLTDKGGAAGDGFGYTLALSGRTIAVGFTSKQVGSNADQGAIDVFSEPASGWRSATQTARLTAPDGAAYDEMSSVAVAGHTIVAGARLHEVGGTPEAGTVYVFTMPARGWRNTAKPVELTAASAGAGDEVGRSVAVSGREIVAGAPGQTVAGHSYQGAAYVFTEPAAGWHTASSSTILTAPDGATDDGLGAHVAVSGRTIAVGASSRQVGAAAGAGTIYVYGEPGAGWSAAPAAPAELTAADATKDDSLGNVFSLSAGTIVGGIEERTVGDTLSAGAGYVFTAQPAGGWASQSQPASLTAAHPSYAMSFGTAVAVSGSTIAVGVPGVAAGRGATDLFAVPPPALTKAKQSRRSWRLGSARPVVNPKHAPAGGTRFSFRLSRAARVTLTFHQTGSHKRVPAGVVSVAGRVGPNRVYFDGTIRRGAVLHAGHYLVRIVAADVDGESHVAVLRFVVTSRTQR